MRKRIHNRRGFTLVEIMIVVLIIGILLAIAVPNFIKARQSSRLQTVIGNLKQIDSAKEQMAMDRGLAAGGAVAWADIVPTYLKKQPTGPVGVAADYVPAVIGDEPTFKGQTLSAFQDSATQAAAVAAAGL